MAVDFLPVCDLLFNIASITTYFCDIIFNLIVTYLLYSRGNTAWFLILAITVSLSLVICQILSLKWYIDQESQSRSEKAPNSPEEKANAQKSSYGWVGVLCLHLGGAAVFWRYSRLLFVPIEMDHVKREMRNLSLLRLSHAFLHSLVCSLVLGYLTAVRYDVEREVVTVAISLSLVNICWAYASFNKHIDEENIHRLILTWIGVILKFLWRLGTVSSRLMALVLYTSVYHAYVFLFFFLHTLCMFLWLFLQRRISSLKECGSRFVVENSLLSYAYLVDFVHMEECSAKIKLILYYSIVLLENVILAVLWSTNVQTTLVYTFEQRRTAILLVVLPFLTGLAFMVLYYQIFHVSKTYPDPSSSPESGVSNNSRGHQSSTTVFNCTLYGGNSAVAARKKKKKIPRVIPPPPGQAQQQQGPASTPFWKEPLPNSSNGFLSANGHYQNAGSLEDSFEHHQHAFSSSSPYDSSGDQADTESGYEKDTWNSNHYERARLPKKSRFLPTTEI